MKTKLSSLALWACLALLLVLMVALTAVALEPQGILTVCPPPGAGCDYTVIQEAIDNADPGDTIRVAQGVYTENLSVDKPLTLEGGYESAGWTRDVALYETVIDGSSGGTEWGDWDGGGVRYPAIIHDGGAYEMWYAGRDLEGVWRIGYATSPDGLTWTKDAANPVLDVGAEGEWDALGFVSPFVIKESPTSYEMWYSGADESGIWRIGYATSTDGIHWTEHPGNPVLDLGDETWNNVRVMMPSVIYEAGLYKMWLHTAGDDGGGWLPYIAYATSSDGIVWAWDANNPLFSRDAAHDWESAWIWGPSVLHGGGDYQMWYTGWSGDEGSIGYATALDETAWSKHNGGVAPVLSGTPAEWDEGLAVDPFVLYAGGTYTIYYDNYFGDQVSIGYATSTDGISWTKSVSNPVLAPGTPGQWGQPVVLFIPGSESSVFDGFTVRNGQAEKGAGISVVATQATIQSCTVTENSAHDGGGGIHVEWGEADATIRDTQILNNSAGGYGGGIEVTNGAVATIVSNHVVSNTSLYDGGGGIAIANGSTATISGSHVLSNTTGGWASGGILATDGALVTIQSSEIAWNRSVGNGSGGIRVHAGSVVTVTDNLIRSNVGTGGGGIAATWYSLVNLYSNTIVDNQATEHGGGGLRLTDYVTATADGNLITHNEVGGSGGGMAIGNGSIVTLTNNVIALNVGPDGDGIVVWGEDDCDVHIINNTIVSNAAEGIQADAGNVLARNNIIYGNNGGIHNYQSGATVSSDHNTFWDNGWDYANVDPGLGDIAADAAFRDAANGDYRLGIGSPCIDAGTPDGAPAADIEGMPRDAAPDIGAYEWTGFGIYLPLVMRNY